MSATRTGTPRLSRRTLIHRAGPAGLAVLCPALLTSSLTHAAPAKVSQQEAGYQEKPKGDQECANCAQFEADSNSCKLVKGSIRPDGWCELYVAG